MEESLTFWNRLYAFFVSDDKVRWKAMGWIMAASGAIGSVDLAFFGESLDHALVSIFFFVLLSYLGCIAWYCSFRRPSHFIGGTHISRRAMLRLAVAASIGFAVSTGLVRRATYAMEFRLEEAAGDPTSPLNMEEARRVLERAKAAEIRIAPATIRKTAGKFMIAAKENRGAWDTSIEFLNFKSFLNVSQDPSRTLKQIPKGSSFIFANPFPETIINVALLGLTTPEHAPQLRRISSIEPNPSDIQVSIPAYLKIHAGKIVIDGFYFDHIILDSTHVIYHGGRVRLGDVYFINCTFEFEPEVNDRAFRFAETILESGPAVTFSA